jgi:hypothetical protein
MVSVSSLGESCAYQNWRCAWHLAELSIHVSCGMALADCLVESVTGQVRFEVLRRSIAFIDFVRKMEWLRGRRTLRQSLDAVTSSIELALQGIGNG